MYNRTCDGNIRSSIDDFQAPLSHNIHVDQKLFPLLV